MRNFVSQSTVSCILIFSRCVHAFSPSKPVALSRDQVFENLLYSSTPSDSAETSAPEAGQELSVTVTAKPSKVERCYQAWNDRDFDEAISCFSDDFSYDDGQYLGIITDKPTLRRSLERNAEILPVGCKMVVDHIAVDENNGNIGSCWHVEREDGITVPLTRGCSFYTTDKTTGLIKTGFKVTEMVVKTNKSLSDNLVGSASKFIQATEKFSNASAKVSSFTQRQQQEPKSIIEKYFQAWNNRDLETALDCFTDDATYQTEDPVFVDTFRGKDSLKEHLLKNAATLPSSCQIILDDLAIDESNGTFGVRWHLEVDGVGIPNLKGCSMYTKDKSSGLLKSGYDVTESPVKVPEFVQDVFAPLTKLLF